RRRGSPGRGRAAGPGGADPAAQRHGPGRRPRQPRRRRRGGFRHPAAVSGREILSLPFYKGGVLHGPQIFRLPGRCPGFDSLFWIRCGPHGSASNSRERSFLTGQKGTEKPAATSEARGTAKGPAGPFGNPGALRRSPETLSTLHNPSLVFTIA